MRARKDTAVVALAATSAIGSVGLAAGGTASALLGAELAHSDAAAGLPLGLLVLGSGCAAVVISRLTAQVGRIPLLAAGYLVGSTGALMVIAAAAFASLAFMLVGCVLMGGANAAIFLTRYAAAELAPPERRGHAVGVVLASVAIGAVAGPLLLAPTGALADALRLPQATGLFLVAAVAFVVPGAVLPRLSRFARRPEEVATPPAPDVLAGRARRTGLAVLALGNFVMVGLMTVVPVRMMSGGQSLEMIGTTVSLHVAGMFAPSPVSGWLADRTTPRLVARAGCLLLCLATLAAAPTAGHGMVTTMLVLAVLGIGWNLGVIGGSTLVVQTTPPDLRPRVEGLGELAMGAAAAISGPIAGLLVALGGLPALCALGAGAAACGLACTRPSHHESGYSSWRRSQS